MTGHVGLITEQIATAERLAESDQMRSAVLAFAVARRMAVDLPEASEIRRVLDRNLASLSRERDLYRQLAAKVRPKAVRSLVVLSDSLALPRPDDKGGDLKGAERTYPVLALQHLPKHRLDMVCQRYFTSAHLVDALLAEPTLGERADVVVHIGLNDCAARMFLEEERLAIALLPDELSSRIVGFARQHRRSILRHAPLSHYVPIDRFRMNLDLVMTMLAQRNAASVTIASIILPPIRFWNGTPGIQENFGRYNAVIMSVASRHEINFFDIDRHAWASKDGSALLSDGMHLSLEGHQMFAEELSRGIKRSRSLR